MSRRNSPALGVDKVNTLRKNEFFIFSSCIIFLCRPSKGFALRRVRSANFQFAVASRANALPPLSPSVTAGRRPRLRGWRFEDGPKGPAEPEPQPGEAEVGARKKMIKEAATWAAPTARRQNLRFCRPRSPLATWKPKGLPTSPPQTGRSWGPHGPCLRKRAARLAVAGSEGHRPAYPRRAAGRAKSRNWHPREEPV